MTLVRLFAFVAAVVLTVPAVADDAKFDAAKLLGDWKVTAGKKAGNDLSDEGKKGEYNITKDKITLKMDGKVVFEFEYTIDAKASPVAIDMTMTKTPAEFEAAKGSKAKGIVELKGDELKLSYDSMGGDRPTKFDSDKAFNFTMKREKAK